jgi:hypothetical protein
VLQVGCYLKQSFDFFLTQNAREFLNSRPWRNCKLGVIPFENVFVKTGQTTKDVVDRSPCEFFFFDKVKNVLLNLFV